MSTTPATRNSETAKAPQLKGWIELFRAGTHIDSKGREFTATREDLDEVVRNHGVLGAAPAVLGHPKHDDPAYAWTSGLRREGDSLFAAWEDINPAFDDGLEAGAYRNRSVKFKRHKHFGLHLAHVGWLGASRPAIEGLATEGRTFSAPDDADEEDAFEFTATDDAVGSLAWAVGSVSELLRGVRDHLIASDGLEVADRVLPAYRIDYLADQARSAREAVVRDGARQFSSQPTPDGDDPMPQITQEQHDAALDAARKEVREQVVAEFSAQGAELAELRKQRKTERLDKVVNDLKATGNLLPADEAEFRAVAEHLLDQGTFEFAAADGNNKSLDLLGSVHKFMAARSPVVKVGGGVVDPKDSKKDTVDVTNAEELQQAAHEFQASEKEAGREITFIQAVQAVSLKHSPLKS